MTTITIIYSLVWLIFHTQTHTGFQCFPTKSKDPQLHLLLFGLVELAWCLFCLQILNSDQPVFWPQECSFSICSPAGYPLRLLRVKLVFWNNLFKHYLSFKNFNALMVRISKQLHTYKDTRACKGHTHIRVQTHARPPTSIYLHVKSHLTH